MRVQVPPQLQYALVAQLEERRFATPDRAGSSPAESTTNITVIAREAADLVITDTDCQLITHRRSVISGCRFDERDGAESWPSGKAPRC